MMTRRWRKRFLPEPKFGGSIFSGVRPAAAISASLSEGCIVCGGKSGAAASPLSLTMAVMVRPPLIQFRMMTGHFDHPRRFLYQKTPPANVIAMCVKASAVIDSLTY